jgi:[acyl-carrier-protein] S-malonyltransferase
MKKIGIVFPGQGSQKVGMGQDLFESLASAKEKVSITNAFLKTSSSKTSLTSLCINGPQDSLTQTENAQPGLFLVSAILLDHLEHHGIYPTIVAGHSLGELTAYYASKVLSFKDALCLIKERGQAMANATESGSSGMAAVLGQSIDTIQSILTPYHDAPVTIANINCPGQIVISGEINALNHVITDLKTKGAKVISLPVSGAFHSPLMTPAHRHLRSVVDTLSFSDAAYPIILNRTGQPESSASSLKDNIPKHVISSVQWIRSIQYMATQCDLIIECGSGKVLSGLIKKIDPEIRVVSVSNLESISTLVDAILKPN